MNTIESIRSIKKSINSLGVFFFLSAAAHGHGFGIFGERPLDWRTDQIARVVAKSNGRDAGQLVTLDGKQCLEGTGFAFDVDDRYVFDIDETVQLEVEFYQHATDSKVEIKYERNGEAEATKTAQIPAYQTGSHAYKQTFALDRARFANRGWFSTDFSIGINDSEAYKDKILKITVCNVSLKRSYATAIPKSYGQIALEVLDETGRAVPARVGIYDSTGRLPLPSDEAIAVKRMNDVIRVINLTPGLTWPARNPSGFYINGSYGAKLPIGQYELAIAKGPEYRMIHQVFKVESNRTRTIKIQLQRWDNLPTKGWYSGDNHIHYIRNDKGDDPNLLIFTEAEDVHVASILQAGNIANIFYSQYAWNPVIGKADNTYSFVPGQEDPRTMRRGHTISLHIKEPVRDPPHYLLYHTVFEKTRAQGGVTGYAHMMGNSWPGAVGGMALDVPFGLVDFAEVMQAGIGGSNVWFDFLNLGYKLAPSAGTDYMWDDGLPGAERSYVRVSKPFTLQGWFDGLKRGETFVTNGPMLELAVNGKGMGSELQLQSGDQLTIDATAAINPDIDALDSLELIEQGNVIKTVKAKNKGETRLWLHHETTARHGTWFVLRANGKQPRGKQAVPWLDAGKGSAKMALSGAVYVYVDGKSFWKPSSVASIVQRLKQDMQSLMTPETGEEEVSENWETREPTLRLWDSQKGLLQQRIDQVMPIYDDLVKQAKAVNEKR